MRARKVLLAPPDLRARWGRADHRDPSVSPARRRAASWSRPDVSVPKETQAQPEQPVRMVRRDPLDRRANPGLQVRRDLKDQSDLRVIREQSVPLDLRAGRVPPAGE